MALGNRKNNIICLLLVIIFIGLTSCTKGSIGSEDLSSKDSSTSPSNSNTNTYPLAVNQSNVELFAGDDFKLTITGGQRPYSFEDLSGNFNKSTFLYKAPQDFFSLGHVLKIFDSAGAVQSVNFKVKNFEKVAEVSSSIPSMYHSIYSVGFIVKDDGTVFVGCHVSVYLSSVLSITGFVILKSTDLGNTFDVVYFEKGNYLRKFLMLANGDFLIFTEEPVKNSESNLQIKISKDQGVTFSKVNTINSVTFTDVFIGKATGIMYLAYQKLNAWGDRIAFLYKSSNQGVSWVKITEFDYTSLTIASYPQITDIVELSATDLLLSINVSDYGSVANFADQWLVLKSSDSGASWVGKDNVSLATGKAAVGGKLVKLPNGNILSIGSATNSTNYSSTVTRISVDGGNNWSSAETYNYAASKSSNVTAVLIDNNNKVWMSQSVIDSSNAYHAILRSSSNGIAWTLEQDKTLTSGFLVSGQIQTDNANNIYTMSTNSYLISGWNYKSELGFSKRTPTGIVTYAPSYAFKYQSLTPKSAVQDVNGNIIVASTSVTNNFGQDVWNIKLSSDKGVSWTDSDTYNYPASSKTADVVKVISNLSGTLFALGTGTDNTGYKRLIVRKGVPTSATSYSWTTVNDSAESATPTEEAVDMMLSKTGRIFVAAYSNSSGYYHWIVKKSSADFSSWANVEVNTTPSTHSYASSLSQDDLGRIYFMGSLSSTPVTYFLRVSDDDGVTWSTIRTWSNYNKNFLVIAANGDLFNIGVKGVNLYFEKSSDRGVTWSVVGQKTYDLVSLNSVRIESNSLFLFGNFIEGSSKSSVVRYSITESLVRMIDNVLNISNLIGITTFNCDAQAWCLLSSSDGARIGEKIGYIRRMSK